MKSTLAKTVQMDANLDGAFSRYDGGSISFDGESSDVDGGNFSDWNSGDSIDGNGSVSAVIDCSLTPQLQLDN